MKKLLAITCLVIVCFSATAQRQQRRESMPKNSGSTPASFTDTFIRTDANPMSTTSSSGGTWTTGPGSLTDCIIDANRLAGTGFWSGAAVASPTFAANQYSEITLTNSTSQTFQGVYVRMQSASAAGYLAFCDSDTAIFLYKMTDSGTVDFTTKLGATFTVSTLVAGDVIRLSATGTSTTTLEVFVNGISQGTRTDSTSPYTSGQPGTLLASQRRIHKFVASDL